jgi:hypothetical protein
MERSTGVMTFVFMNAIDDGTTIERAKGNRGVERENKMYYHHRQSHSQPTQPRDRLSNPQSRQTTNQGMSGCCCF